MVDDRKVDVNDDDSKDAIETEDTNIERINQFVTSSDDKPKDDDTKGLDDVEKILADAVDGKEPSGKIDMGIDMVKPEPKKTAPKPQKLAKVPEQKREAPKVVQKAVQKPVQKASPKIVPKTFKKEPQKKLEPKSWKPEPKKTQQKVFVKPNLTKKIKITKNDGDDKMPKRNKQKKSEKMLLWIGIGVLAVILIVALIFILKPAPKTTQVAGNQTTNDVAATVNGVPIYLQDITAQYNNLNPAVKGYYSIESLLNKSIDEMLMVQYAKQIGLVIAPSEIDTEINGIKAQNGLSDQTLLAALQQQGMTMDTLRANIENTLLIRKLLNNSILQNISVSSEAVQSYYDANLDQFKVPAKVTVQHILIGVSANRTSNQSKDLILQVQQQLNDTNFCDLAAKYSDDAGSKDACGEYTFGNGEMVPEFETASFALKINETTLVETQYGWHLIKKLADIPAHTMNLSDAYSQINTTLYNTIAQNNFDAFVSKLRSKAVIVNYVTKTNTDNTTTTVVEVKNNSLDDFAKCLTANNVSMYGAYWCPHCNNQKTMFGDSFQYVNYVECADANNPQVQTPACDKAGISGYPTWVVNGKQYPGEQTLADLAKMTGCTLPQ